MVVTDDFKIDYEFKISDFGLSRPLPASFPLEHADNATVFSGDVVSKGYRPPELLFGKKHKAFEDCNSDLLVSYGFQLDVWAVGVILLEFLIGGAAFWHCYNAGGDAGIIREMHRAVGLGMFTESATDMAGMPSASFIFNRSAVIFNSFFILSKKKKRRTMECCRHRLVWKSTFITAAGFLFRSHTTKWKCLKVFYGRNRREEFRPEIPCCTSIFRFVFIFFGGCFSNAFSPSAVFFCSFDNSFSEACDFSEKITGSFGARARKQSPGDIGKTQDGIAEVASRCKPGGAQASPQDVFDGRGPSRFVPFGDERTAPFEVPAGRHFVPSARVLVRGLHQPAFGEAFRPYQGRVFG